MAPLVLALALALTAPTTDPAELVGEVVSRVDTLLERGEPEAALKLLEDSYAEHGLPVFLYISARVERRRGNCRGAIEHFEAYLGHDIPQTDRQAVQAEIESCEQLLADAAPAPPPPAARAQPTDEAPPRASWTRDPLGWSLGAVGVAGVVAGSVLLLQRDAFAEGASTAGVLSDFNRQQGRARTFHRAGVATLSVGAALVGAAIVRFVVVGSREGRAPRTAASPWVVRF